MQYSLLTLDKFSDLNKGVYKCVAKNHGNLESKNVLELKAEGKNGKLINFTEVKKMVRLNKRIMEAIDTFNIIHVGCGIMANSIVNNNHNCKPPDDVNCQQICTNKGRNVVFSMTAYGDTNSCNVSW